MAIFESVAVPLVWAGLSFVLIRRGGWRDRLITGLLLCSTSVALAFACWLFFAYLIPDSIRKSRVDFSSTALFVLVIFLMAGAVIFLSLRLRRGRPSLGSGEIENGR